jgi:putative ABC transport system permease protein
LTLTPGSQTSQGVRSAPGGSTTLTYNDAKAIASSSKITTVASVSPVVSQRSQVTAGRNNTNTQVYGVTPTYSDVRKLAVNSGTFITQRDVEGMTKVAVLGPQVVTDLFGEGANPLGKMIRVEGQAFRVIGVTVSKGGSGFQNQDDIIYVPITTAQKLLYGIDYINSISIEAKSGDVMSQAQDEVGYLLLERHKITDTNLADFSIFYQIDILATASSITGTFTTLLSGIAGISQ